MQALPHHYKLTLAGGPEGSARVSGPRLPDLDSAPPTEFDGPGDRWSPEHLFVASVLSCFLFTFRAIAKASKLEFARLECEGEGVLDRGKGGLRFSEVILRAEVTLPAGSDIDRAIRLMEKADKGCLVSRSLACPVRLEAAVAEG